MNLVFNTSRSFTNAFSYNFSYCSSLTYRRKYLYLLDHNETDDFTDEDWDILSQMVAEKDKQVDKENEKMKRQNKRQ